MRSYASHRGKAPINSFAVYPQRTFRDRQRSCLSLCVAIVCLTTPLVLKDNAKHCPWTVKDKPLRGLSLSLASSFRDRPLRGLSLCVAIVRVTFAHSLFTFKSINSKEQIILRTNKTNIFITFYVILFLTFKTTE